MSEAVQVALIVAIVQLVTHWRANRKLDHITVLTNSTLTGAKAEIEALKSEVIALKTRIHDMVKAVNE